MYSEYIDAESASVLAVHLSRWDSRLLELGVVAEHHKHGKVRALLLSA